MRQQEINLIRNKKHLGNKIRKTWSQWSPLSGMPEKGGRGGTAGIRDLSTQEIKLKPTTRGRLGSKRKWPMLAPLLILYTLGTIGVLLLVFGFLGSRLNWWWIIPNKKLHLISWWDIFEILITSLFLFKSVHLIWMHKWGNREKTWGILKSLKCKFKCEIKGWGGLANQELQML